MWFALLLTLAAVVAFVREKLPLEITSVVLLTLLLLFGQFFPLLDASGHNQLNATTLLSGFANPSLIAVLALLVMGQGIIHTDALRGIANMFAVKNKRMAWVSMTLILVFVMTMSAFMNNTPLVIIAIPLMQGLAVSAGVSQSRVMMPLSFVAILGGMTTLIGSSTNLLVSSAMTELGYDALGFFDFIVPGAMLAAVGFVYVILIAPRLLKDRSDIMRRLAGKANEKEFVAELDIDDDSKLIGMECIEGRFPELRDLNIKMIQRGGHIILPPFEGFVIAADDILIVSATRDGLSSLLSQYPGFLLSDEMRDAGSVVRDEDEGEGNEEAPQAETRVIAEMMISPASRLIDLTLDQVNMYREYGTVVLGIQRRARVVRRRLGRVRLEAGDVLLVTGKRSRVDTVRDNTDFIVLSGSKSDLRVPKKAPLAAGIFLGIIAAAALGVVSIPVAAITGSVLMIATGCLNIRQATRAIDRKIFLLVGSMLALGIMLQVTGGAQYIADLILSLPMVNTPLSMATALFIIVAIATNLLSNNACAVLFTPIAMNLASSLDAPLDMQYDMAFVFAVTVIFGANCSFASPIGYQTNLLVMGPGHYRFRDFIRAGVPLMLVLWGAYHLIAKYYFGL